MVKSRNGIWTVLSVLLLLLLGLSSNAWATSGPPELQDVVIVVQQDTIPEKRNIGKYLKRTGTEVGENPFDLKWPSNYTKEEEYDSESNRYIFRNRLGEHNVADPTTMTFEEFLAYKRKELERKHLNDLAGFSKQSVLQDIDPIKKVDVQNSLIDRLFGGRDIKFEPNGNVDMTLGYRYYSNENPSQSERAQRNGNLDFDMDIRLNAQGQIGDKLKLNLNYNPKSTFDFDQVIRINYDTENFSEDEIIKVVDAGNVSLPLNSRLIQGRQNLFGFKLGTQFGPLKLTGVVAENRSQQRQSNIQGGSEVSEFEVPIDKYDANRHYFLAHYFRDNFNRALENLPQINSLVRVTKIEVWVTNDRNEVRNSRDIVAIADLGETDRFALNNPRLEPPQIPVFPDILGMKGLPDNEANPIYDALINSPQSRSLDFVTSNLTSSEFRMEQSVDFEKVRARKLNFSEFTFQPELGMISLRSPLRPNEVLGVAFEYQYNGETYQVGELSNDVPNDPNDASVIFVKMLKSTTVNVHRPIWDLMMKNFYNVGAYRLNKEDFRLDIFYNDPGKGDKRFIPEEDLSDIPLLNLFNLDRLNSVGDPSPDGQFDFVTGVTFNLSTGNMMFPVLEPFGELLKNKIKNPELRKKYVYQALYDSTLTVAREFTELNQFRIKGTYKSTQSNVHSLNATNVQRGSVKVYAGGQELIEGVDYEVNYSVGEVLITNTAYTGPGANVRVDYEDRQIFNVNQQTMVGLRADYEVSKNLQLGATYMHMFERPTSRKVNFGDDPINNRIFGADIQYSKESPFITRMMDKLPFYATKEKSEITLSAEGAYLLPSHSRAINEQNSPGGTTYLDDFEGASTPISLMNVAQDWSLASIPQGDMVNRRFQESLLTNDPNIGVNRAKISWFRPEINLTQNETHPFYKTVSINDIFPNRQRETYNSFQPVFNIHYQPQERGPYNYDVPGGTSFSAGLSATGQLERPETRWGGIMRALRQNDFEASNIEFIEFWLMNPFTPNKDGSQLVTNGKMYINLGNISEDILRDSRYAYENGIKPDAVSNLDTTRLGVVSRKPNITKSWETDLEIRKQQDVGLDGMDDNVESQFLSWYLDATSTLNREPREQILADPANDNYKPYGSFPDGTDLFDRYSNFNNTEGNSSQNTTQDRNLRNYRQEPDDEDLNRDNTLNEAESYFEYEIPLDYNGQGGLAINEYVTDTITTGTSTWYRFKVPIDQYTSKVGSINDFRSMRFIRLYFSGFQQEAILRFTQFQMVTNQWRKYRRTLREAGIGLPGTGSKKPLFDVNKVNIEENSAKEPFRYVLPPGVQREIFYGGQNQLAANEQSLSINVCDLEDGDAVGLYKLLGRTDMRDYKQFRLFLHAEPKNEDIEDGALVAFVRIGSDFENNYYEYEMPLVMSKVSVGGDYDRVVWPDSNEMNFDLDLFKQVKVKRNSEGAATTVVYQMPDPKHSGRFVKVVGNPNLGRPRGILFGIRNVKDDGTPKCAEVWVNELRLSGLNERGGGAAIAKMGIKLADLGRLNISGSFRSIGYGNVDERLIQRNKKDEYQYDIATNLNLDKFFPEKFGLSIPFYYQYYKESVAPQFDPYDEDIKFKDKLNAARSSAARDTIRDQGIESTTRETFSFNNVKKNRTNNNRKPMPWDVENFAVSYSQTKEVSKDPIIAKDQVNQYKGSLNYDYQAQPIYITPLKNVIKKDKYLKLLTGFNFNLIPNTISFSNVLDRYLSERTYRFVQPDFSTWQTKRFTWDRTYRLGWNLTRALSLNFDANNQAVVDELVNRDRDGRPQDPGDVDKYMWDNLRNFGRTKNYEHNINVNYKLPFDLIPITKWMSGSVNVRSNYNWNAGALNAVQDLGNVLQNGQVYTGKVNLNFTKLYGALPYLKRINDYRPRRTSRAKDKKQTNRDAAQKRTKKEKKSGSEVSMAEQLLVRPLMALRKGSITYTQTYNSIVPGYAHTTQFLGMNQSWDKPGWRFILGFQPTDQWLDNGALNENQYFTESVLQNKEVVRRFNERLTATLDIEPYTDFDIKLTLDKNFTDDHFEFFKIDRPNGDFRHLSPRQLGSYTISYITMNTLFNSDLEGLFDQFERNRAVISARVGNGGQHSKDGAEYNEGFGKYQQDVLVPAFLAAYSNKDASAIPLDFRKIMPLPNWTISYDGLSKLPMFKETFSRFSVRHQYTSKLQINRFQSDPNYDSFQTLNPLTQNYYSQFEIPEIVENGSFNPLVGIDIRTKSNLGMTFDLNKGRNLALNLTDFRLYERNSTEYRFGFDYKIKNVNIPWLQFDPFEPNKKKSRKRTRRKKESTKTPTRTKRSAKKPEGNDLDIQISFSYTNNRDIVHQFDTEEQAESFQGSREYRLTPSIEYEMSKSLSLRLFSEYSRSLPWTARSYPTTNFFTGVTMRFKFR